MTSSKGILTKNEYGQYWIPAHHDRPVTRHLRRGQVYQKPVIEFCRRVLKNNPGDKSKDKSQPRGWIDG